MAEKRTTIIDSEITFFNVVSPIWWTTTALSPLINQNKLRVPEIIQSLVDTGRISREEAAGERPLTGVKILDVGCGGGFLSEPLAKLGAQVTGLDPCLKLIECAREHIKDQTEIRDKVDYVHGTVEEFVEVHAELYDHVVAAEILDHIQDRELFVKSCVTALKPGGTMFVSTINRTVKAWLRVIFYYEYIIGNIPKGAHHWNLLVTPDETRSYFENAKCSILKFSGWWLDSNSDWTPCDATHTFYYMIAMKKY